MVGMPHTSPESGTGQRLVPSANTDAPAVNDPTLDHAPKKKREKPSRKNTNVRNLVWAIGLNLVIVAVLAVVVVGLGDSSRDTTADRAKSVNISETAARAQEVVDFPLAAPTPQGWATRDAKISTNLPHTWRVRYTAPSGTLVTLVQQQEYSPALITSTGGTVRAGEPTTIAGKKCDWLEVENTGSSGSKQSQGPQVGLACHGEASGIVFYGGTSRDTISALAEHALHAEGAA